MGIVDLYYFSEDFILHHELSLYPAAKMNPLPAFLAVCRPAAEHAHKNFNDSISTYTVYRITLSIILLLKEFHALSP